MRSLLTEFVLEDAVEKYNPDEPRDAHGRWSSGSLAGVPSVGTSVKSLSQKLRTSVMSLYPKQVVTIADHF